MQPLLFLDIDGVLVTHTLLRQGHKHLPGHRWGFHQFDPNAVAALNSLTERSGAQIVISSTWRKGRTLPQLREILANQGVTGTVIGKTGNSPDGVRGNEIQTFLEETGTQPEEVVILDDDADMLHLTPRLIQTHATVGLTSEDAQAASDLLTGIRQVGILHTPWSTHAPN